MAVDHGRLGVHEYRRDVRPKTLVLPDGNSAGRAGTDEYERPTGGVYQMFDLAGMPLLRYEGREPLTKKNVKNSVAYVSGVDLLATVTRPQSIPELVRNSDFYAGVTGTDCLFNGYASAFQNGYFRDNNDRLLDPTGHEELVNELLDSLGMKLVYAFYTRPAYTGVAFPEDLGLETWNHVTERFGDIENRSFVRRLFSNNGNGNPVLVTEYTDLTERVLKSNGLSGRFRVMWVPGSCENYVTGGVADGILDTIERGNSMHDGGLRVLEPLVSIHYPVMFMRKDTPYDVAEHIYEIRDALTEGAKKMPRESFQPKLDHKMLGWKDDSQTPPEYATPKA